MVTPETMKLGSVIPNWAVILSTVVLKCCAMPLNVSPQTTLYDANWLTDVIFCDLKLAAMIVWSLAFQLATV